MSKDSKEKKEPVRATKAASKTKKKQLEKPSQTDKLAAQVKELEGSLEELQDRHLRLRAEFDNYRKRKGKEIARLLEYGGETSIRSLLPVVDDLERMVESAQGKEFDSKDSLVKGIQLILENAKKRLKDLQVEPIESVGKAFDPELHDAMLVRKSKDHGDNEVIEEYEKGYRFKDKVIRHAKVVVSASDSE